MTTSPDLPRNQTIFDTIKDLRKPPTMVDDGWIIVGSSTDEIAPSFQNSWTGVSGKSPVSFFLDKIGIVRFRGILVVPDSVTYPSTVFTLPTGFRSEYDEPFIISISGGGYANVIVKATSGDFVVESVTPA